MADRLIENHRSLGTEVEYSETRKGKSKKVRGVVTGVRRPHSLLLWNRKTGTITPQQNLIQLRIKPNGGGRAFWTPTMRDCEEDAGNAQPVETGLTLPTTNQVG